VRDIDIDAAQRIDHLAEAIQANPVVAINRNAMILLDGRPRHLHPAIKTIVLRCPQQKRLVNLCMLPTSSTYTHESRAMESIVTVF
jgi:hypothetical protein